ncbi:hypothetical protein BD289DRAFT_423977 [Coniella lustricola]|uniref:Hydroxyproline-rich glyco protein n=1 Tax=Coniella lustricola TaxID=2025994 RepID=A0A2T3AJ52_9PEZI|nr:hypothetical protein BD289DRAFT_423977 [Coniella lustricola]
MEAASEPPLAQNDEPALPEVITIAPQGDILLDVTFENSRSTLQATGKTVARPRLGQKVPPAAPLAVLKPRVHLAYRVDLATLQKHSRYFTNLLTDTRFQEARDIADRFQQIRQRGQHPQDLPPEELPHVHITDDDEATRSAGREIAFADMLRILHAVPVVITTSKVSMLYIVTLAVFADRFACTAAVSRHLTTGLKFKWPATPAPRLREDDGLSGLSLAVEELVRQKILVSWLLEHPPRFAASTRELVLFGSHRWAVVYDDEAEDADEPRDEVGGREEAVWWYLPDDLEEELHYRRRTLLRTLASIPAHFLHIYTTRTRTGLHRQCKLGYDSSSACDSFQLGEMVRFLIAKRLLVFRTFSPPRCSPLPENDNQGGIVVDDGNVDNDNDEDDEFERRFAAVDVNSILVALKQCPNYQIDRHHTNCGLRTRIMPILDYIGVMLSTSALQINLRDWKSQQSKTSWQQQHSPISSDSDGSYAKSSSSNSKKNDNSIVSSGSSTHPSGCTSTSTTTKRKKDFTVPTGIIDSYSNSNSNDNSDRYTSTQAQSSRRGSKKRVFRFTRAVASDQRLRYEGAMMADRMARDFFAADAWDWTPEDIDRVDLVAESSRHLSMPVRRK